MSSGLYSKKLYHPQAKYSTGDPIPFLAAVTGGVSSTKDRECRQQERAGLSSPTAATAPRSASCEINLQGEAVHYDRP